LVIGGTGMLQAACSHFIQQENRLTIIGRNETRLQYFKNEFSNKNVLLINVDYTNTENFLNQIQADIDKNGVYHSIICWMHQSGEQTLKALIQLLKNQNAAIKFYHLLGSYSSQQPEETYIKEVKNFDQINYMKIVLGYKRENNYSRWLSNQEISEGTIEAVTKQQPVFIIGQIEPWEQRP